MLDILYPWVLIALPMPFIVRAYCPPATMEQLALMVPFFQTIQKSLTGQMIKSSKHHAWLFWYFLWILYVIAAAQPVWVDKMKTLNRTGRDLMLAIDLSESMRMPDMLVSGRQIQRITAVKSVVGEFAQKRTGDRLGLILFGSDAFLQVPLTYDVHAVVEQLRESLLGFAGSQTAIGYAIGRAVERLRDQPQKSRVLILLTDGANTAGKLSPMKAAELAAEHNIKIYTVGIGAETMLHSRGFLQQRINPSLSLDEAMLRNIASSTGGRYFRARDPQELQSIYTQLEQLEPTEQGEHFVYPQKSLFHYILLFILFMTMLRLLVYLSIHLPWIQLRKTDGA